jgi:NAD-dependent dihydropyrimidine dehydrogenase PreA subunit
MMPLLNGLREKFPWFPTIDPDACRKDLQCLNFCPHDVFEWEPETGRPIVAHRLQCSPGCEICLEGCETGALSLPTPGDVQIYLENARRAGRKTPPLQIMP